MIVQHGETDYNKAKRYQGHLDILLNAASPLSRAYVTAEKIAKSHGMTIAYTDDRLKEIDYGDWSGKYIADLKENEDGVWQVVLLNSVAHLGSLTLDTGVMK